MQDQTAGGGAALPRGAEGAPEHALERQVLIGVVHHDHGVLAAHLQREPLVHPAAGLADDRAGLGRPGKGDDRDLRMLDQRLPHRLAPAVDQLDHLGRESRLEQDLHQQMHRVRHVLRRLDDHRVPAEQRGEHLPGREWRCGKLNGVISPTTPIGRR